MSDTEAVEICACTCHFNDNPCTYCSRNYKCCQSAESRANLARDPQTKLLHMMAQHQMAMGEYIAQIEQGHFQWSRYNALTQRNEELGKAYCEFCQRTKEGQ